MTILNSQKEMRRIASEHINKDSFVLEIGCGDGNFAKELKQNGIRNYLGIDINKKKLDIARKNIPNYFFVHKNIFEVVDILDDADIIVALEVFEHLENDFELLNRIPKGKKIIFSVPNSPYKKEHKRWFEIDGWKQRYGEIFDFDNCVEYVVQNKTKKNKRAFLFITRKR